MTQAVQLPDGTTLNFPDGMSQPDMASAIQKNFPKIHQDAAAATPDQPAEQPDQNMGAFVGQNIGKGIASGLGAPVDLINTGLNKAGKLINKDYKETSDPVGGSAWIEKGMTKAGMLGQSAKPRSSGQEALASGLQFAGNSLVPIPGLSKAGSVVDALKGAGGAFVGGVGSDVAHQIAPDSAAAPILGAMVPGGIKDLATAGVQQIKRPIIKAAATPFAKEGEELTQDTGIPLSLGQQSGSKSMQHIENASRQSFVTADKVFQFDKDQAQKAIQRVDQIANKISSRDVSAGAMGEQLQGALNGAVKNIAALRKKTGDADYGAVREMAAGQPIIHYGNTADELDKIIDQYKDVGNAESQAIVSQATSLKKNLTQTVQQQIPADGRMTAEQYRAMQQPAAATPKTVDVESARKNRAYFGDAARGSGDVFKDVNRSTNQKIAGRLYGAINRDFQSAEEAGTPVATALARANSNYRDYSKSIDYVHASALGKLLGKDVADAAVTGHMGNTVVGEKLATRFQSMTPTEARTVTNILNTHNPSVLADAKSFVLRDALRSATDLPVSAGKNAVPMSYSKFIKALPKPEMLEAMGFTKREIHDVGRVTDAMIRAGDRSGYNSSGTAAVMQAQGLVHDIFKGVKGAANAAAQVVALRKVADAMVTPEGRQALLTISAPASREKDLIRALAVVNSHQTDKDSTQ